MLSMNRVAYYCVHHHQHYHDGAIPHPSSSERYTYVHTYVPRQRSNVFMAKDKN